MTTINIDLHGNKNFNNVTPETKVYKPLAIPKREAVKIESKEKDDERNKSDKH